jgi:Fic family protein
VADATRTLARLRELAPRLTSSAALAGTVLRVEGVASSRIEGVRVSHAALARAARSAQSGSSRDPRALEVLGNVEAIERAIAIGGHGSVLTIADIEDVHRTLLRSTDDRDIAGVVRDPREWIGADDYNPVGADYVPPPSAQVHGFLEDLCAFLGRVDVSPVAQAAIALAQFRNIHPFTAGNGRTGRALVYTVLRRRGAMGDLIPPLSPVVASEPKAYVGALGAYSVGDVDGWCENFASATTRAAEEAEWLAEAIESLVAEWLGRLGSPRSDSAARQILRELPAQPVVDAGLAGALTGKSHTAVNNALGQLERAGVLQRLSEKRSGRAWEAGELLELLAGFHERVSGTRA